MFATTHPGRYGCNLKSSDKNASSQKFHFFNSLQRLIFIKRTSGLTLYSQIVPYDQRGHVKVYLSFIKIAIFRQGGVASLHNWGEGSIYIAIFVLICRKELISKELNTAKHGYKNNAPPPNYWAGYSHVYTILHKYQPCMFWSCHQ